MNRQVITLNAGSSSIKFALFELDGGVPAARAVGLVEMLGKLRRITVRDGAGAPIYEDAWPDAAGAPFHIEALRRVLAWRLGAFPDANVVAAGHRVVHGGIRYDGPALVTDEVLGYLETLTPFAPLHQVHNIAGMLAAREAWPDMRQVACFDTAFHRKHPFVNDVFALPRRFYDEGVRRYGFHGLSYEYMTEKLRQVAPLQAAGRVVVAHLGNGASMCAILNGRSIASSMGFTPLDGLPMGTRCGQLDPGVVLYLMQEKNERRGDRRPALPRIWIEGPVGFIARHAGARGVGSAGGEAGDRVFCIPHPARARRVDGGTQGARRRGVLRRHWGECVAGA
jgi:acetate kinase